MAVSLAAILSPEIDPAQNDQQNWKVAQKAVANIIALSVTEMVQKLLLGNPSLDYLPEQQLRAVLHGRDPRQELDDGVHVTTSIGQDARTKVEENDWRVANQECALLVLSQSTAEKPKEDTSKMHQEQDQHVSEKVLEGAILKSKSVERAACEDSWVNPSECENLADQWNVKRVHGVHVVCMLALKYRIELRDLQNLSEAAIYELIRDD